MSRQLEQDREERLRKRAFAIMRAVDGGLAESVSRAGGEYTGLSTKHSPVECLLVIKAIFPGGRMVSFCGSSDLGSALLKAVYAASRDELSWKSDKWGGES